MTDGTPPELLNAVRRVATDASTRPLLHWLFGLCRVEGRSGSDFREGQRSIGIEAHALLDEVDPRLYPQLCLEGAAVEIQRRATEAGG